MPETTGAVDPVLFERATNNPYVKGLRLIAKRLLWDLSPLSWRSRSRVRKLQNRHSGKRCVILCNGPSLLKTNFELLESSGIFCFGLNKINLLFERTTFRPNCIVAVNPFVIEQNKQFYNSTEIPVFFDAAGKRHVRFRSNVVFLHSSFFSKFARDCSFSICHGYTVTFVAMQLAFHFGFREVALVGCDHNFTASGPSNAVADANGPDQSHFDPRYFSDGAQWQLPDLAASEYHYTLAGRVFGAFGGQIFNCTDGGRLELFERQPLSWFLKRQ